MHYIGIDPGKKGGVSFINDFKYMSIPMPINSIGEIDVRALYNFLEIDDERFCILEKSQSMPGQSSISTFTYGQGYGKIKAVLELMKMPYEEIHPMKWKKEFQLVKKDKKHSVAVAEKMFPDEIFRGPKGGILDGKAESILLAEYAKRKYKK
jgi:crossover junction endodeoxyribonuclease RuvC